MLKVDETDSRDSIPLRDVDRLTVADDKNFLDAIEHQSNVPSPIKGGLRALY